MEQSVFKMGVTVLRQAFPRLELNAGVLWEFWSDLGDEAFTAAIKDLCLNHTEIYPGTNIIALVRDGARRHVVNAWNKAQADIPPQVGEYAPPPEEWMELKRTLGI